MSKEQLISVRDAATKAGVTEETIRKYIQDGQLRASKKNFLLWDEWFITKSDLARLLKEKAGRSGVKDTGKLGVLTAGNGTAVKEKSDSATAYAKPAGPVAGESICNAPAVASAASESPMGSVPMGEKADLQTTVLEKEQIDAPPSSAGLSTETLLGDSFSSASYADEFPALEDAVAAESVVGAAGGYSSKDNLYDSPTPAQQLQRSLVALVPTSKGEQDPSTGAPWPNEYRERAKTVAEEFLAPLLSRLEVQAAMLEEKDKIIAEQSAQLKLLPDFQRRVTESEEKLLEKEKEVGQLRSTLEWEKKSALFKICAWQTKHIQVEEKVREVEDELTRLRLEKEFELRRAKTEQEEELILLQQIKKHHETELQIMQAKREFQELEFQQIQTQLFKIHDELNQVRNRSWWKRLLNRY
jgi:hypothetical protein